MACLLERLACAILNHNCSAGTSKELKILKSCFKMGRKNLICIGGESVFYLREYKVLQYLEATGSKSSNPISLCNLCTCAHLSPKIVYLEVKTLKTAEILFLK